MLLSPYSEGPFLLQKDAAVKNLDSLWVVAVVVGVGDTLSLLRSTTPLLQKDAAYKDLDSLGGGCGGGSKCYPLLTE